MVEGTIQIKGLAIRCVIGVHPHEREKEQEIALDIAMRADFARAIEIDSVDETIDYGVVARVCCEIAQKGRYHLLETLAHALLHALLDRFPISWAHVQVRKPGAIPEAEWAAVEMERTR